MMFDLLLYHFSKTREEKLWWKIIVKLAESKKAQKKFYDFFQKTVTVDPLSQYAIAYCYDKNFIVTENPFIAFIYAKSSAEKGCPWGMNLLGVFYENGYGTDIDIKQAVFWYEKSAQNKNSLGVTSLANCYLSGVGVEKNTLYGIKLLNFAVKKQNPYAQNLLGNCYLYGKGVHINYKLGYKYCNKSAKMNNYFGIKSMISISESSIFGYQDQKKKKRYQDKLLQLYGRIIDD